MLLQLICQTVRSIILQSPEVIDHHSRQLAQYNPHPQSYLSFGSFLSQLFLPGRLKRVRASPTLGDFTLSLYEPTIRQFNCTVPQK